MRPDPCTIGAELLKPRVGPDGDSHAAVIEECEPCGALRWLMAYSDEAVPLFRPDGSLQTLDEIEDAVIDHALIQCETISGAASSLGVTRATLYRRMRKLYRAKAALDA